MTMSLNKNQITIPVVNFMDDEKREEWKVEVKSLVCDKHDDIVEAHKEMFGDPSYPLRNPKHHYLVWEFDDYRIYVSEEYGVALEVEQDMPEEKVFERTKEYLENWE